MRESYLCPTCDSEVIVGHTCKVCSSNANQVKRARSKKRNKTNSVKKPWEQDEMYDGLDLPDDDFDYDTFVEKEFNESKRPAHKQIGIKWYWWFTALILSIFWIWFML